MIGQTVDVGDHFKKRAAIPLAPCIVPSLRPCGQQFTSWVENTNPERMYLHKQVNFKEKPTFRVRCLYYSFVHAQPPYAILSLTKDETLASLSPANMRQNICLSSSPHPCTHLSLTEKVIQLQKT